MDGKICNNNFANNGIMKIFYRAKERGKEGRLVDLSLENGDRLHSTNLFLFSLSLSLHIPEKIRAITWNQRAIMMLEISLESLLAHQFRAERYITVVRGTGIVSSSIARLHYLYARYSDQSSRSCRP